MNFEKLCEIAEDEVSMIVKVLPAGVKEQAEKCPVSYEDRPTPDDNVDEGILGIFQGASLIEEVGFGNSPHIRIFVENLWEYAECDEQDFRDEVATTYLHELGHYLGWDEDEVAERGLE